MLIKKYSKNLVLTSIITSICILNLYGCSEYNNPEQHMSSETDTTSSATTYSNGDKYVKEVSENISIDASVNMPSVDKIPILNVTKTVFDAEKLKGMILPNEDLTENINVEEGTYIYRFNNGKNLAIWEGCIHYSNAVRDYAKDIYNMSSNKSKWTDEDLVFMTKKDATNLAIDYCEKLGIKINEIPISVKSLNYDLLKEQEMELKKQQDGDFNYYIEKGKIKPKELTKDDELYIMKFNTNIKGINLISKDITLQTVDRMINGSQIEVSISKDGVISLDTNSALYTEESTKEEDSEIVSLDDAVEKVHKIYDGIITKDKIKVTNIALEYAPILKADNNEFELVPTWVFDMTISGIDTKSNESIEHEKSIYINAITGEEII